MTTPLKGIDVSRHNGSINWSKVDVDFAMIRAGYGEDTIDSQFAANAAGCSENGIPFGVYWFSYALDEKEAELEALKCLEVIKPYTVEYPIAFDFEYDSVKWATKNGVTMTKELATKIVEKFCSVIEKAGYYVMNYANKDYLTNMFDASLLKKYDLWYAYWNKYLNRDCGIWQYASNGQVAGINGNVDLNYSYKDYKELIHSLGLNNLKQIESDELETFKNERDYWKQKFMDIKDFVNEISDYGGY